MGLTNVRPAPSPFIGRPERDIVDRAVETPTPASSLVPRTVANDSTSQQATLSAWRRHLDTRTMDKDNKSSLRNTTQS